MEHDTLASEKDDLDVLTRLIHLGLMVFGILAWLSGGWGEGYEHAGTWASRCTAGSGWTSPRLLPCG